MPILNLKNPTFISVTGAGRPNSGGTVEVYVADGLYTTLATIFSDQENYIELTNPVTLDDAGTKEIWYDVKVDIIEKTSAGATIRETENLDPNASQASVQGFNLAQNGSFEIDSTSDGQPDNWTISPYTGSAIAITNDVVTDGVEALEFNTAGAGSGGGTATSAKFPVTEGSTISISWSFRQTNGTGSDGATTNTFTIVEYDEEGALVQNSTITMPSSGSAPLAWTRYNDSLTVQSATTQCEIKLVGIASGGSNLSSKAYFDGIIITNQDTLVNVELTNPTINGIDSHGLVILDEPETLNSSVITNNTWVSTSTLASTTLTDASAVAAIVKFFAYHTGTGDDMTMALSIRKAGTSITSVASIAQAQDSVTSSTTHSVYAMGETTVNLDSNYDFEFRATAGLAASDITGTGLYLVGYYV